MLLLLPDGNICELRAIFKYFKELNKTHAPLYTQT